MKTIIKTTVAVLSLAFLSTTAFANSTLISDTTANKVSAYVSYDQGLVGIEVDIDNATEGGSTVVVTDAAGNVLLTDSFKNDHSVISKNYLVDEVPAGEYFIRVTTNDTAVQKSIDLGGDQNKLQAFAF